VVAVTVANGGFATSDFIARLKALRARAVGDEAAYRTIAIDTGR
jgi:hypothetical protein